MLATSSGHLAVRCDSGATTRYDRATPSLDTEIDEWPKPNLTPKG